MRSSRTISFLPSPSASSAAAPWITAEFRPELYWVLDFPLPLGIELNVPGERVLGHDQGGAVQVHQAQTARRRGRHRAKAAGEGFRRLARSADQQDRRAISGEDQEIRQAVAIDVDRLHPRGRAAEAGDDHLFRRAPGVRLEGAQRHPASEPANRTHRSPFGALPLAM